MRGFGLFILCLAYAIAPAAAREFHHYVLALSWSPTYCASPQAENDRPQCDSGRRLAFVVHGLWPQHESGWPENCATRERWVPEARIAAMLPLMPSKRLIIHQWRKHGSCAGTSQNEYFGLTRALFEKVRIPPRYVQPREAIAISPRTLVEDFMRSNPWLRSTMIEVHCGSRRGQARLEEIRICFSRQGDPIACGGGARQHCRAETLQLAPAR